MKKILFIVVMCSAATAYAAIKKYGQQHAQNATRACIPTTTQQNISTSTTSAASTVMTADATHYIVCDTATHVRFAGTAPTAVATDFLLPASTVFPFFTGQGQADFVAAILDAGTGTCQILECE